MNSSHLPKGSQNPLLEATKFLTPFALLFRRKTRHKSVERYITGLFIDLRHKAYNMIAQAIAKTSTEQLQYLLTMPLRTWLLWMMRSPEGLYAKWSCLACRVD